MQKDSIDELESLIKFYKEKIKEYNNILEFLQEYQILLLKEKINKS